MSVLTMWAAWKAELDMAITDALNGPLTDGLKEYIHDESLWAVYMAYGGGGYRRGEIGGDKNLEATVSGDTLTIRNVTQPQGAGASMKEVDFVESGSSAYRQPFPRPFMTEGRDRYVAERAEMDLATALRARGFEVH